jgi:hypothetical protein
MLFGPIGAEPVCWKVRIAEEAWYGDYGPILDELDP